MVGVRLTGLTKRFADVMAVHPLDLEIGEGELVVLVGPSGCGKTTVLRMIAGLEEPSAGDIFVGDRRVNDLEPKDRDIAMVFQSYALYPHMTVRENLGFGLRMRKVPRPQRDERIRWAASLLGLEALLDRRPGQLSGGQRQRVALGRALVREPRAFLFDEPLSNLDARLRTEMRGELAGLHGRLHATMLYVTHDQIEAMTLGQRIAVLRDGRLQQYAAPLELYRQPANLFVAGFVGTPPINTVTGTLTSSDGGTMFSAPGIRLPWPGLRGGGEAVLGVRAEALRPVAIDTGEATFATTVRRLEPLGNEVLVYVDGPSGPAWVARVPPETPLREGETIGFRVERAGGGTHLFSAADGTRLT